MHFFIKTKIRENGGETVVFLCKATKKLRNRLVITPISQQNCRLSHSWKNHVMRSQPKNLRSFWEMRTLRLGQDDSTKLLDQQKNVHCVNILISHESYIDFFAAFQYNDANYKKRNVFYGKY